jgi:hypothetical protein
MIRATVPVNPDYLPRRHRSLASLGRNQEPRRRDGAKTDAKEEMLVKKQDKTDLLIQRKPETE